MLKINSEAENYGVTKKLYGELKKLDPVLVEKFAYLEMKGTDATRAADILALKEMTVWAE